MDWGVSMVFCKSPVLNVNSFASTRPRMKSRDVSVTTAYLEITASAVHSQCHPAGFDCHYPTMEIFFFTPPSVVLRDLA